MLNQDVVPQFQISRFSIDFTKALREAIISDPAFRLLIACLSIRESSGRVPASNAELGRLVPRKSSKPMSRSNVGRYMRELVDHGLLVHDVEINSFFVSASMLLDQQHEARNVVERTTSNGDGVVESTTSSIELVVGSTTQRHEDARHAVSENAHPRHNKEFNNNLNTSSTTFKKKEYSKEVDGDFLDTETRELFPNAPFSIGVAVTYFESFFAQHAVENQSARSAALDFFEYWENKRDWSKIPRGRKTPVRLDSWKAARPHATTWAIRIRDKAAGRDVGKPRSNSKPLDSKAERIGASSIWMTAAETLDHATKYRLEARHPKFYEHNKKTGKAARFRFLGFHNKNLSNPRS